MFISNVYVYTYIHTHCNTLQHSATLCNAVQRVGVPLSYMSVRAAAGVPRADIKSRALQHTATHCNTLPHTATHCNTLQRIAMHCNALQHTSVHFSYLSTLCVPCFGRNLAHWNTLQHTATHCNTLQHTATHCNTLQHSAREYRVLAEIVDMAR